MPALIRRFCAAALFLVTATAAAAQDDEVLIDGIFDLRNVQSVHADSDRNLLLITMRDHVLLMEMFPNRLIGTFPLDILGTSSLINRDNVLVTVGEVERSTGLATGGQSKIIFRDVSNPDHKEVPAPETLDTSPYTALMFSEEGDLYAVNPTHFSVLQLEAANVAEVARSDADLSLNHLILQCGLSGQVSLLNFEGQRFYVSSVIGTKEIEFGPLALNEFKTPRTECFRPDGPLYRSLQGNADGTKSSSLLHALVDASAFSDAPDLTATAILALDPDTLNLTFIPLESFKDRLLIIQSQSISYDLNKRLAEEADAGRGVLFAVSRDASVIMVSIPGTRSVHRWTMHDRELEYLGRFDMRAPVRQLTVSQDGRTAVIVTDADEGAQQATLIRHPALVPGFVDLGVARLSVSSLQTLLSDSGVAALRADGIYGRQTETALQAYIEENGQNGTPEETRTQFNDMIRGLFPLRPPQI